MIHIYTNTADIMENEIRNNVRFDIKNDKNSLIKMIMITTAQ